MTTLQGIIARSATNTASQFETLGYITTNISNFNTHGYKGQRFENYLKDYGRIEGVVRTDYSPGRIFSTARPLDVAIDGAGFIPITKKDGSIAYTREGSFATNADGYLVTNDGWLVGSGIKIPANYYRLTIATDGNISVIKEQGDQAQNIGKIPLVNFNNPEGLKQIEGNKVLTTKDSGEPMLAAGNQNIQQGKLESSNVDIYSTVNDVLRNNSSIIACMRLIKVTDDLYSKAINLRQ